MSQTSNSGVATTSSDPSSLDAVPNDVVRRSFHVVLQRSCSPTPSKAPFCSPSFDVFVGRFRSTMSARRCSFDLERWSLLEVLEGLWLMARTLGITTEDRLALDLRNRRLGHPQEALVLHLGDVRDHTHGSDGKASPVRAGEGGWCLLCL